MLRSFKALNWNVLTFSPKFRVCEHPPQTTFFHWTKQQKKALYFNKPVPKMKGNFYDTLLLPYKNKQHLLRLLKDFLNEEDKMLSMQNCSMLLYNFAKENMLIDRALAKLQKQVYKRKGQFDARSVFGGLYAAIGHNNQNLVDFFMTEYEACGQELYDNECFELIIALNRNTSMTLEQKHEFWDKNFKEIFMEDFSDAKQGKITKIFQIFDTFNKFEYYDEVIWDKIISLMENKNGWIRTVIIQKLYPFTGTFPRAKQVFDRYYIELSRNKNVAWRYDLEKLRFYSSEEMIAKSQQDIQLSQTHMSLWQKPRTIRERNRVYQEFLEKGQVKGQDQIIRDKAQSFAYAIKNRYDALKQDGVDFSNLTEEQFKDLFGKYDEEFMKEKEQPPQNQQANEEQN